MQKQAPERVVILKRGAKFFVLAAMAIILHERNGKTFLNKLKGEVAVSKTTGQRLKNYATMALEWYVEASDPTKRCLQFVKLHVTIISARPWLRTLFRSCDKDDWP